MTEQEYIDATDLAKIRMAVEILSHVLPENSSVVKRLDYQNLMIMMQKWEERLYKKVKLTPTQE